MPNPAISQREIRAVTAARTAASKLSDVVPADAVIYAMLIVAHQQLHGAVTSAKDDEIRAMMEHWGD